MGDPRAPRPGRVGAGRTGPSPATRVLAHRAIGLAVRELHDAAGASVHLRRSIAIAERHGLDGPAAEARMSLGLVLDDLGRPVAALRELDQARSV